MGGGAVKRKLLKNKEKTKGAPQAFARTSYAYNFFVTFIYAIKVMMEVIVHDNGYAR